MIPTKRQFNVLKRKRKKTYGGVRLPIVPGYGMWSDPAYGYLGGMLSVSSDVNGQPAAADNTSMSGGCSQ